MSGRYDWWLDDCPDPAIVDAVMADLAAGQDKWGDLRLVGTPKEPSPLWELWEKSIADLPADTKETTE